MENMQMSIRDGAYFEQISESGKQKSAGYTIACILGAIFILGVLFWVFNRFSTDNNHSNSRVADHNCQTRERLGILEGQMMSVGTVLGQLVPKVTQIGEFTAAQLGGLNEYTRCADKGFASLQNQVYHLDNAVFTSRCGDERGGCCGDRRDGNRRFAQTSTYAPVSTQVTVTESCVN